MISLCRRYSRICLVHRILLHRKGGPQPPIELVLALVGWHHEDQVLHRSAVLVEAFDEVMLCSIAELAHAKVAVALPASTRRIKIEATPLAESRRTGKTCSKVGRHRRSRSLHRRCARHRTVHWQQRRTRQGSRPLRSRDQKRLRKSFLNIVARVLVYCWHVRF